MRMIAIKNRGSRWCVLLAGLLSVACATGTTGAASSQGNSTARTALLEDVSSWVYQLQNVDVDELGESEFDLAVVDYSADGSDDEAYSAENVETMKGSGSSEKLVIAYLSIGEAEDYRYYFDAEAAYMDEENPEWPGNFKVHYWEEGWQATIESYVDRLIAAGFDGAYLDIIDGYEYYGPGGESGLERASAADDMANFVIRIANYARESDEDFLIFPQNGSGIINDSSLEDEYLSAIDGIGAEDTFYFGDEDENNDLDEQTGVIENLEVFRTAEKTVLAVDYLTDEDKLDDFYERALANGYVPYATERALDVFVVNDGHAP